MVTLVLAKTMNEAGLRAFLGKLSMDTSGWPPYAEPSAQASLDSASTCSDTLLRRLGELAAQGRDTVPLYIQGHLAESED